MDNNNNLNHAHTKWILIEFGLVHFYLHTRVEPGWDFQVICLGKAALLQFIKYPDLTRILYGITCINNGIYLWSMWWIRCASWCWWLRISSNLSILTAVLIVLTVQFRVFWLFHVHSRTLFQINYINSNTTFQWSLIGVASMQQWKCHKVIH